MQSSYAQALEHLGIKRGEPGSDAKHAEVKQFYGVVNAAAKLPRRATLPPPPKAPQKPIGVAAGAADVLSSALGIETSHQREVKAHQEAMRQWREKAKQLRQQDAAAWEQMKAKAAIAPLTQRRGLSPKSAPKVVPAHSPTRAQKPPTPR